MNEKCMRCPGYGCLRFLLSLNMYHFIILLTVPHFCCCDYVSYACHGLGHQPFRACVMNEPARHTEHRCDREDFCFVIRSKPRTILCNTIIMCILFVHVHDSRALFVCYCDCCCFRCRRHPLSCWDIHFLFCFSIRDEFVKIYTRAWRHVVVWAADCSTAC